MTIINALGYMGNKCKDNIIAVKDRVLFMGSPTRFLVVKKTRGWVRKKAMAIVVKKDSVEIIRDKSETLYIPFCNEAFREFFTTSFPSVKAIMEVIPDGDFLMYKGKIYVGSIPKDVIFDLKFKNDKLKLVVAKNKKKVDILEKYPPSLFVSVPEVYYANIDFEDRYYDILDAILILNNGDNYVKSVTRVPLDCFGLFKVSPELLTIHPFAENLLVTRYSDTTEVTTNHNYYNFSFLRMVPNRHSAIKTIGLASLGWDL